MKNQNRRNSYRFLRGHFLYVGTWNRCFASKLLFRFFALHYSQDFLSLCCLDLNCFYHSCCCSRLLPCYHLLCLAELLNCISLHPSTFHQAVVDHDVLSVQLSFVGWIRIRGDDERATIHENSIKLWTFIDVHEQVPARWHRDTLTVDGWENIAPGGASGPQADIPQGHRSDCFALVSNEDV